jgi:hypothetical protein
MADLPECPAEKSTREQTGREEVLTKRALDLAARFYPNRESEHCMALARAIYSALLDTDREGRSTVVYAGRTTERIHKLLTTIDTLYHDHAFSEIRAEAQALLIKMESEHSRPSDNELRHKIQDLVWDKIMWPWHEIYKTDRHVPHLYLRSDPVLIRLVNLITDQFCAVRQTTFSEQVLNPAQRENLERWCDEQNAKVLADQQQDNPGQTRPYFGAIGGSLTWTRTATSLGTVVTVIFCKGTKWEAEIDLTDYSEW